MASAREITARPPRNAAVASPNGRVLEVTERRSRTVRRVFAGFLALHGLAHLAGTSDVFAKASDGASADWLAGAWALSDPVLLRVFGVAWALVAVAYVAAAVVVWAGRPRWPLLLGAVTLASLALVVIALWSSVIGALIDVALLAVAGWAGRPHRQLPRTGSGR